MKLSCPGSEFVSVLLVITVFTPAPLYSQNLSSPFDESVYIEGETNGISGVPRDGLIFTQLWDDLSYLSGELDFYGLVGGLSLVPSVFGPAFRNESPELTELWEPSPFADNLFEVGEMVGDGRFPVLVSATTWSIGRISGSTRLKEFGSDLIRAQIINGLVTTALKGSINRTRPDGAPYSYPSGHTSSAFTTAGVVYTHFGKNWGIPVYLLAGYVGLSRLQEGKHYLSDIIAGGIIGSYISRKLARRGHNKGAVTIAPLQIGNGVGLSLTLKL